MAINRGSQVARMYVEIQILKNSRVGLTTREIHESIKDRFPVSIRTVYRDLGAMELAGFPLTFADGESLSEAGTRWQLMHDFNLNLEKKLVVKEEEMKAIQELASTPGQHHPALSQLLARIQTALVGK